MFTILILRVMWLLVQGTTLQMIAQTPTTQPSAKGIGTPKKAGSSSSLPAGSTSPLPKGVAPPKAQPTDAEKIANANDSIKQAKLALEKIQNRLDDPEGEYQKAEAEFGELNNKLKELKAMVAKLKKEGMEAAAVALEATMPTLQEDWQLAKERFDIAIRQKKATLEAIAGLKDRIASDQQLLDRLEGKTPPPGGMDPKTPAMPPGTGVPPAVTTPPTVPPGGATTGSPSVPTTRPPSGTGSKTTTDSSSTGTTGTATTTGDATTGTQKPETGTTAPAQSALIPDDSDPLVKKARENLAAHKATLREIESRLRVADERVKVMERSIQSAEKILQLERESVAQAEKSIAKDSATLKTQPPADPVERDALAKKLAETEERLAESKERVTRISDRLVTLNETLTGLKNERDIVNREAEAQSARVATAEEELNSILSPTATRNLFNWAFARGPRILLIMVGMLLLHFTVRQFSRSIVRFITRNSQRGSPEDRENRANTLVGVFRYVAGLVVFGGGFVMILDEVGVPVVPLMGGAAVLGLAVAFGAQNLIRDYFTGFMMLMEDQYSVNDVVRIGQIAGLVEQISLRMTVLRDLEGVRHFIPHGTITSVSNLTHGWSRAKLDIGIAYKENVDDVIDVLMDIGKDLRLDPVLGKHILENPEMLGVESLADSGVVIRFLMKTRPLKQWPVKREMLRRIKNRFDELGIEIPFPHRTVYHRHEENAGQNGAMSYDNHRPAA